MKRRGSSTLILSPIDGSFDCRLESRSLPSPNDAGGGGDVLLLGVTERRDLLELHRDNVRREVWRRTDRVFASVVSSPSSSVSQTAMVFMIFPSCCPAAEWAGVRVEFQLRYPVHTSDIRLVVSGLVSNAGR